VTVAQAGAQHRRDDEARREGGRVELTGAHDPVTELGIVGREPGGAVDEEQRRRPAVLRGEALGELPRVVDAPPEAADVGRPLVQGLEAGEDTRPELEPDVAPVERTFRARRVEGDQVERQEGAVDHIVERLEERPELWGDRSGVALVAQVDDRFVLLGRRSVPGCRRLTCHGQTASAGEGWTSGSYALR
jgi:hypothetical protein